MKKEGAVSDDGGDITEFGPEMNLRAIGGCPFGTTCRLEGTLQTTPAASAAVTELEALNAERTRQVNEKGEKAEGLSDYIVQVRSVVKGLVGADSSEYMIWSAERGLVSGRRRSHGGIKK